MKTALLLCACSAAAYGGSVISIRETPSLLVSTGCGTVQASEMWLTDVETHVSKLLVRGREDPDITKTIAAISAPQFSKDHSHVFFVSEAWAVSGSIQKVEIATKKISFLIDGSNFEVVKKGLFDGLLLVNRQLIDENGRDSYLWIVSPDGRPLVQIGQSDGEAAKQFRKLYLSE